MAPPTLLTLPRDVRYMIYDALINTYHILSITRNVASSISPTTLYKTYKTITYHPFTRTSSVDGPLNAFLVTYPALQSELQTWVRKRPDLVNDDYFGILNPLYTRIDVFCWDPKQAVPIHNWKYRLANRWDRDALKKCRLWCQDGESGVFPVLDVLREHPTVKLRDAIALTDEKARWMVANY